MAADKDTNLLPPLLIAAVLVLCFAVVGCMDFEDALIQEAMKQEAPKLAQTYVPPSLVIPYSAYVCQDSGGKPRCKAYVSGTTRKEIR